jgi:predicted outer membrane repeat protein
MSSFSRILGTVAGLACLPAHAGTLERQLALLDPESRAHQVCAIKGIDQIRADKRLKADRIKSGITSNAVFKNNRVVTKGGAVHAEKHWYTLKYDCEVTSDQMKAVTFTYEIGKEIPADRWEDLGLWQ